jgi:hypothetical protein
VVQLPACLRINTDSFRLRLRFRPLGVGRVLYFECSGIADSFLFAVFLAGTMWYSMFWTWD